MNSLRLSILCAISIFSIWVVPIYAQCKDGRAVGGYTGGMGYGACNYPPIPLATAWNVENRIFPAAVNEALYNSGILCGSCYELTGPLGRVTVLVSDSCPRQANRCAGDRDHFVIPDEAFFQLVPAETDVLLDMSYRPVPCNVNGTVKLQFASDCTAYYCSVTAYNHRAPVTGMAMRGNGWSQEEMMTHQPPTASFAWNKRTSNTLSAPLSVRLQSSGGQSLIAQFDQMPAGQTLDTGVQFMATNTNVQCPMAMATSTLYDDAAGSGWSLAYSFKYSAMDAMNTVNPEQGLRSIHINLDPYGGLQFTRPGGFATGYFATLTFAVRSAWEGYSSLRVYFGDSMGVTLDGSVGTQWRVVNISLSDLQPSAIEYALVFQNNQAGSADLYFDDIRLLRNNTPVQPTTTTTTTTAGSTTRTSTNATTTSVTTTTTGGNGTVDPETTSATTDVMSTTTGLTTDVTDGETTLRATTAASDAGATTATVGTTGSSATSVSVASGLMVATTLVLLAFNI